ncbi:MAG TPA: sensor histidine kinase, partial [Tichowtungia sp.]|nr:sensor histidine kinase [Tichowtungia sp.]
LPVRAIGTDWELECSLPLAVAERRSVLALFFGLTVTALMTGLLLILAGRTRRIEAEVQTRTDELRVANRQLEENIRERAQMEEEINELSAREQRRIGRDLHDSLGQKLTGAVFLSRSLLNWFEKHGAWGMGQNRKQKTEDRVQKTEDGLSAEALPKAERQKTEVGSHKSATSDIPHSTSHNSPAPGSTLPAFGPQADHARTLNETLKEAVSQVRNMARGLASVTLNDESLEESLHQLTDEMSALYDIPCKLTQTGPLPPLDRKTKEQLYFIAREAVNNAARHAKPNTVTVKLAGEEDGWSLSIKDDGTGLSGGAQALRPETDGMGLRIMRHRANRIGAEFSIESSPDKGVCIVIQSRQ